MNWTQYFRDNYYERLTPRSNGAKRGLIEGHLQRGNGFAMMFEFMLQRRARGHRIIETGTLRNPGNWKDGQSARLFVEFCELHDGSVRSVDIDATACERAREALMSPRFEVTCSDSVSYLGTLDDLHEVDLFYLDSWDVKWENDTDSAEHHLREFQVIEPYLGQGTVVAIDDNSRLLTDGRRTGKGRRIVEYLDAKGIRPILDAYQIIYRF